MSLSVLFPTMIELFSLILVGFYLGKRKIIDQNQNGALSYLASSVFCPCLVIASVYSKNGVDPGSYVMEAVFVGFAFYILLFLLTLIVFKWIPMNHKNIYRMSFMFYNTSFVGYPLMNVIYGEYAIFIFSILHMAFNLFVFSYGIYLVNPKGTFSIKDMMTPGLWSSIIALILYFGHIPLHPNIIDFFSILGNATVPVSMLVIGVSLSFVPLDEMKNVTMYVMVCLKLIGMPILCFFVNKFLPISDFMKELLIISFALPAGSMIVILANQYKGNSRLAASVVFVSTFLSMFTIPLLLNILI